MNVVHKQELPVFKVNSHMITLHLPPFAKVLRVSRQNPKDISVFVWYLCNPDLPNTEPYTFLVVETGHHFPASVGDYLGSEIFNGGQLVLHFFHMVDAK